MWVETACRAVREKKVLDLQYDSFSRSVEVRVVGYTKEGHAVMLAWQVAGGSASGERVGWKLMRLDEAVGAAITDSTSAAPRQGFESFNRALARVVCIV